MCGMRPELEDSRKPALEALDASAQSGMPVDPRIWLQDRPATSHPACIAVKAAAEQGLAERYLRRLREGLFCRMRKLDSADALVEEARVVGLEVDRFRIDLASHGTLEAFAADLERAKAVPVEHHAEGGDRVKLPSVEFRDSDGAIHAVYGYTDYASVKAAALAAGANASGDAPPAIEHALMRFGSMATPEVAAVCQLPGPLAPAALWRMASGWRVTAERVLGGELWSLSSGG
jgi:thioredoxin family protein